jgi:hypothetical protein
MSAKTVTCPLCRQDARVYDLGDEADKEAGVETASDQGNGKPKLECLNPGCGLFVQTESVDDLRRVVMGKM